MSDRDEPYLFKGEIVRETPKAWLFRNDVDSETYWLPKSLCEWDGVQYIMTVPGWIVEEREMPR